MPYTLTPLLSFVLPTSLQSTPNMLSELGRRDNPLSHWFPGELDILTTEKKLPPTSVGFLLLLAWVFQLVRVLIGTPSTTLIYSHGSNRITTPSLLQSLQCYNSMACITMLDCVSFAKILHNYTPQSGHIYLNPSKYIYTQSATDLGNISLPCEASCPFCSSLEQTVHFMRSDTWLCTIQMGLHREIKQLLTIPQP